MKATGIVRRIDELGRVVIPKEIRRTLRIREGDPLEIFTDRDGEVILKKYSPIGELGEFAKEYAEALYKTMGHLALICDRDTFIAAAGPGRKEYADQNVSKEIEQTMEARQSVLAGNRQNTPSRRLLPQEADGFSYTAQMIVPVLSEGEAIGAVILASRNTDAVFGEAERKVAQTAAGFLGRQLEQ